MNYEEKDVLVDIRDVHLTLDGKSILAGVDAEVKDLVRPDHVTGQVIGILGPSGVGKSMFSRILAGLQPPTRGSVLVGPKLEPVKAGSVGYVAQNYPLLRHRTVLENLILAAKRNLDAKSSATDRSHEYLERFDLQNKASSYPSELSGGQRQRVAIAQQLLCSSYYLIMDEPTTGLDPVMRDNVIELIRQVASLHEESTIFIVSHDIPAVLSVADHIWVFGRNRDQNGVSTGAQICHRFDLIARGIAWASNPETMPEFHALQRHLRNLFSAL